MWNWLVEVQLQSSSSRTITQVQEYFFVKVQKSFLWSIWKHTRFILSVHFCCLSDCFNNRHYWNISVTFLNKNSANNCEVTFHLLTFQLINDLRASMLIFIETRDFSCFWLCSAIMIVSTLVSKKHCFDFHDCFLRNKDVFLYCNHIFTFVNENVAYDVTFATFFYVNAQFLSVLLETHCFFLMKSSLLLSNREFTVHLKDLNEDISIQSENFIQDSFSLFWSHLKAHC